VAETASFTFDDMRQVLCIIHRSDADEGEGQEENEYWYEGVVKGVEVSYARRRRSLAGKGGCTLAREEGGTLDPRRSFIGRFTDR
jgi:hypothetical protein